MSVLPVGFGSALGGYQIERSLRFNSADTAYLNRTPASATNQKTWTWSAWVKRSVFGATKVLFDARASGSNPVHAFYFTSSDQLGVFIRNASATVIGSYNTSAVFRDPSAWYHIAYKFDSTQATATNRVEIYVNGVLQSITASTTISQNADAFINSAISHGIGAEGVTPTDEFDGYMTEVNFVDSPVLVGSTTNASTTVTLTTGTTTNIGIGWSVGGTNIPSGATVSSITNSTQFVISAAATGTGSSINIGVAPPVSAFGETDTNTGVWKPKAYSGTYGTNGFYLKFADNSGTTSTTLGKDSSGNGNNWTPNLFSVTAGTGNDSLVDSPTNYGSDTGVGGEVRGNYCTLNRLTSLSGRTSLSNGNLQPLGTSSLESGCDYGTIGVSSGKWYWECTVLAVSSASSYPNFGAVRILYGPSNGKYIGDSLTGGTGIFTGGTVYKENSLVTTVSSYTTNDVIGIALDVDNLTCAFYKNGTLLTTVTGLTAGTYWPGIASYYNSSAALNTGQRPFQKWNGSAFVANTAPSGFKALCTQNLPTPTIGATSTTQANDYFNPVLYTGNGYPTSGTQSISGVGFQPDFVWIKYRSGTGSHSLYDAIRGATKGLFTNLTNAEETDTNSLTSLNSDGFSVGTNSTGLSNVNVNSGTYVAWNWKANGAGSSNTAGQITSTVSANNDAGFSIVTYTGNGSANQTVGHGCKVGGVATAPVFGILKDRDTNSNNNQWQVFHTAAGDKYAYLSTTAAFAGTAEFYPTSGSSTTVTVGRGVAATTNESGDRYVMYLFAPVAGYSAFGSYEANNSADGVFVYLGFRPKWIMFKRSSTGTNSWVILDSVRNTYNVTDNALYPNQNYSENGTIGTEPVDFLSNGFKIKTSNSEVNGTGTYIYAAFAESPFKYSLAR